MPPGGEEPGGRERLLAALLAAGLAALVFAGPLFGGRSTLSFELTDPRLDVRPWADPALATDAPINPITPDVDLYVVPGIQRVRQLLADGSGPWWDSSQLMGYPLAGNLPFPLFSPLAWPALLLDPVTACDVLLWLHTAVALYLAWRTARRMGCGPGPAAVGAVGFAFSAWMTTRWHLPYLMFTAAWWPGLLGALERLRQGRWRAGCVEGGVFGALALVSGFPQVGVALLAGFAALLALDRGLRCRPGWLAGAGALALALGLACPQFVVSGSVYRHSMRSSPQTRALTAQQGLPAGALFAALLPEFFGRPSDFAGPDPPAPEMKAWLPQRRWFGPDLQDNVVENALYPGALMLLALLLLARRGADARGRRLLALALAALLGCLLWPWLVKRVPGLELLAAGNVKRALVLTAVCLPFAGALALQGWLTSRRRLPWVGVGVMAACLALAPLLAGRLDEPDAGRFAAGLGYQGLRQGLLLAAAVAALAWARRAGSARPAGPGQPARAWRQLAPWLPALVLAVDLLGLARAFNPHPRQQPAFPPTPAIEALVPRDGRLVTLGGLNLLPPSAAAVNGLRCLLGAAPMVSARSVELLSLLEAAPRFEARDPRVARPLADPASLDHPLLDLLQVSTVIHADRGLAARSGLPVLFEHEAEGLAALGRPGAGPRAFLCEGAEVVPAAAERLRRLARRDFPVHATVLLEAPPGRDLPARGRMLPVPVQRLREGELVLRSAAPFPGVLVLTEAWDPGWQASVDGVERPVLIADHALLGVLLEPGQHEVVFRYAPPGLGAAVVVTGLSGLALLALLCWRRRPSPGAPQPSGAEG